ncbi:MAG: TM0106 family RecB-like putative nuclease [Chloroflexi bacterium]|nr:MAG: TM0106 family RecB-like putative nuclease [Chloroflexota bacterium]
MPDMQTINGQPVYSATDLVGFLACEHLTNLEHAALTGLVARPMRPDPELDRIALRGIQHEERFRRDLEAAGHEVQAIHLDASIADQRVQLIEAAAETTEAMRRGVDVITQATLFDGSWRGHADFLRRVETRSNLGAWSYEVWDTKLARHTKGSAILQLSLYSALLGEVQGLMPERMHVALGGSAHAVESHRVADYAAYVRMVRADFLDTMSLDAAYPPSTQPDPVEHCDVCRWSDRCDAQRRAQDDLSLVAGISARQRRLLRERGVDSREALGRLPVPLSLDPPLKGSQRESMTRVREQARLQVEGERAVRPLYELLPPARDRDNALTADRGLTSLPAPSRGDLFFDMEGDPFAFEDGIDYLFGVLEPTAGDSNEAARFHAIWALDAVGEATLAAERTAFEAFIDLVMARLEADPQLHVYHYAPYEPTAMRRLMGRYATREAEVDGLLRAGVFVDLFRAVRQGVRASFESYSIKKIERLYGFTRAAEMRDANSSIVEFERWLERVDDNPDDQRVLDTIEAYNRDDCVSTWRLRDWLEERRAELEAHLGEPLPRPTPQPAEPGEALPAVLAEVQAVVDQLVVDVPEDEAERDPDQHARWLLAQLLNWHRREDKSAWRRYFELLAMTDEERIEDRDAIGGLTYEGTVGTVRRSAIYRFRFPPQEHHLKPGTQVVDETGQSPGTIVAIDDAGTVDLRRGLQAGVPAPSSLIPKEIIPTDALKGSLLAAGAAVVAQGIASSGPEWRAARDLLRRTPPRVGQVAGDALIAPGEHARDAARRLVAALDHSTLAVQGPPGSGKTTVGAQMVVDLVGRGKRVGVTANSHEVIGNLLSAIAAEGARRGVSVRIAQNAGSRGTPTFDAATPLDNDGVYNELTAHTVDVVGGTAWLWSREELRGSLDVLFIDEAGQLSLANTVAVSGAAANLVLLGDPQQLDQPLQGSHPPGAERSALGHLLGAHQTMPPHLGLFLDSTWRLHPDVCAYTSEAFYEGRLHPEPSTQQQALTGAGVLTGTGLRYMAVDHEGNASDSDEEASALAAALEALFRASSTAAAWRDTTGTPHAVSADDVLVITPYNAQVGLIEARLATVANSRVRVSTVDKFQGQEAPIAIYSMATSSADEAPRGMEFLYSLHRLNVASSRAQCLTVLVASPRLLRVRCRTPRQMRLANALARFVELARG